MYLKLNHPLELTLFPRETKKARKGKKHAASPISIKRAEPLPDQGEKGRGKSHPSQNSGQPRGDSLQGRAKEKQKRCSKVTGRLLLAQRSARGREGNEGGTEAALR